MAFDITQSYNVVEDSQGNKYFQQGGVTYNSSSPYATATQASFVVPGQRVTPFFADQSGAGRDVSQSYPMPTGSGVTSQSRNRNINAASSTWASATNTATWTNAIYEVTITPEVTTTQGAVQNSQACLVAFDAPNDATASAWLADTGSSSTDVNYEMVFNGVPMTFMFSSGITRMDVKPIGTGNTVMRVLVGAN